jgi:hypothetical protein
VVIQYLHRWSYVNSPRRPALYDKTTSRDRKGWEWDEGNEGELAQHRIMPTEVYQVYGNGPKWAPNVAGMLATGR